MILFSWINQYLLSVDVQPIAPKLNGLKQRHLLYQLLWSGVQVPLGWVSCLRASTGCQGPGVGRASSPLKAGGRLPPSAVVSFQQVSAPPWLLGWGGQFLAGHWLELPCAPCGMDLSLGQLTAWQLAPSEWVKSIAREESSSKMESVFSNFSWEWRPITSAIFCLFEVSH